MDKMIAFFLLLLLLYSVGILGLELLYWKITEDWKKETEKDNAVE